jgi:hypothetical protein
MNCPSRTASRSLTGSRPAGPARPAAQRVRLRRLDGQRRPHPRGAGRRHAAVRSLGARRPPRARPGPPRRGPRMAGTPLAVRLDRVRPADLNRAASRPGHKARSEPCHVTPCKKRRHQTLLRKRPCRVCRSSHHARCGPGLRADRPVRWRRGRGIHRRMRASSAVSVRAAAAFTARCAARHCALGGGMLPPPSIALAHAGVSCFQEPGPWSADRAGSSASCLGGGVGAT